MKSIHISKTVKIMLIAVVCFFTLQLSTSFLEYAISYPTEKHREVAHKLYSTAPYIESGDESEEYNTIFETPENNYSNAMSTITVVISILIFIVAIYFCYHQFRRRRLKNPVGKTALASAIGNTLMQPLIPLYSSYFVGQDMISLASAFGSDTLPLAMRIIIGFIALASSFIFILVISLMIAYTFESLYKRKHSFEVE